MTRRKPHYQDDDENLFDSFEDVERELFGDDDESAPFYEDRDEIEKIIEEELGPSPKRRKTRKITQ